MYREEQDREKNSSRVGYDDGYYASAGPSSSTGSSRRRGRGSAGHGKKQKGDGGAFAAAHEGLNPQTRSRIGASHSDKRRPSLGPAVRTACGRQLNASHIVSQWEVPACACPGRRHVEGEVEVHRRHRRLVDACRRRSSSAAGARTSITVWVGLLRRSPAQTALVAPACLPPIAPITTSTAPSMLAWSRLAALWAFTAIRTARPSKCWVSRPVRRSSPRSGGGRCMRDL